MGKRLQNRITRAKEYLSSDLLSFSQLMQIMLPIAWEQIFLALVSIVSIWLLSFDGENSVSVVNMIAVINTVFTSACLGIATGGTVLVAQNIGAGQKQAACNSMVQTMGLAFLLSALAGTVLYALRGPLIGYLLEGAGEEIISQAVTYFGGFCLSFPLYALYQSFAGAMRGWGHTKVAWYITLTVRCMELALIAFLLLYMKLGILGITLSMILSRLSGVVMGAIALLRKRRQMDLRFKQSVKLDGKILRGILMIAIPLALEQFFFNSGKAVSQRYIAGHGTAHMAANGVVNAIFDMINLPQITLRETLVTVVGMCIGFGRPELAKRYVYRFMRTIRVTIVALMPLTIPLSVLLVMGYGLSWEADRLVYMCLALILTCGPLFLAGSFAIPGGLRAGGDAGYVSIVSLLCMWGVRVTASYLFASVLGLGVVGINLAMVIEWALRDRLYRLRLRGARWYSHKLIATGKAV